MSILELVKSINSYENSLYGDIIAKANAGIYYTHVWKWEKKLKNNNGKLHAIITKLFIVYSYDKNKLIEYITKPQTDAIIRFSKIVSVKDEPKIYNTKDSYIVVKNAHYMDCCKYYVRSFPRENPTDETENRFMMEILRTNEIYEKIMESYYDDYFQMDTIDNILSNFEAFL
jgi:hypothetical protein